MLTKEDNELLTQVGPGTPMGQLLRQYWIPALLSSELQTPDGSPMRVRLLGENLIAFRDTAGRIGLLGDSCSHRGASLFFGRNEEEGLRCVYHGWKYDVGGRCVDMPNEPTESNFKDKIRHPAYPCVERGGIVWSYMGPRTAPPELPDLEWNMAPDARRHITQLGLRHCNWVQALEGDFDACHTSFLHSKWGEDDDPTGRLRQLSRLSLRNESYSRSDPAPRSSVVDMEYGVMHASCRSTDDDKEQWRIYHFLLPFHTYVGGGGTIGIWVPIDDEYTMTWRIDFNATRLTTDEYLELSSFIHNGYRPTSTDWLGRWRFTADETNDYLIDRERQRTKSFTGMPFSNAIEDGAVTTSMGHINDRTKEHLGTTDTAIVRVRRRLIECARALAANGTIPPGVEDPTIFGVRATAVVLPKDSDDWLAASEPARKAFIEQRRNL